MREIPLTKGYVALVDDADYETLSRFKWYANIGTHNVYAGRNIKVDGKYTRLRMHRLLCGVTDPAVQVDHIDHNGLNNQRANLRKCTVSQNQANGRLRKDSGSGIKGVGFFRLTGRWRAQIRLNGKRMCLGYYGTKEEAGQAYAAAARKHFGEFALPVGSK